MVQITKTTVTRWQTQLKRIALDMPTNVAEVASPATRNAVKTELTTFLTDLNDLYTHLLNNVRVNMPKQLQPILDEVKEAVAILGMDQEEITANSDDVTKQFADAISKIKNASANVKKIMSTIVQECNELTKDVKIV